MKVTVLCWFPPSNIDVYFQDRQFLMLPSKSIHTDGVHAGVMVRLQLSFFIFTCLLTPVGFIQVDGTAVIPHPWYLFGALDPTYYETYVCQPQLHWSWDHKLSFSTITAFVICSSLDRKGSCIRVARREVQGCCCHHEGHWKHQWRIWCSKTTCMVKPKTKSLLRVLISLSHSEVCCSCIHPHSVDPDIVYICSL